MNLQHFSGVSVAAKILLGLQSLFIHRSEKRENDHFEIF